MTLFRDFKHIFLYGLVLAILVFALKCFGVWIATQLVKPKIKTVIIEKEVPESYSLNETELKKLNLSTREYEVLQLLAKGHSNADLPEKCISN